MQNLQELHDYCVRHPEDLTAWLDLARAAERRGHPKWAIEAWGWIRATEETCWTPKELFEAYLKKINYVHKYKAKLMQWLAVHYDLPKDLSFAVVTGKADLPQQVKRLPFSDELNATEDAATW